MNRRTDISACPPVSEREKRNKEITRDIAAEGIVLLENDGTLPLCKNVSGKKIALYGNGARCTVKGGTGSGDVNVRDYVTVEQGLEHAGYEITTKDWLSEYDHFLEQERERYDQTIRETAEEKGLQGALMHLMGNPFQEPEFRKLSSKEVQEVQLRTSTAIYVLARNAGEGADRKPEDGDYYITAAEAWNIQLLAESFERFILLLNIGGPIDMQRIKEIAGINAVVNISQGGSAFGDAVAEILTGKVTPSGKLTMTWAKRYEDYPCANSFAGLDGDPDDSWYREGIYVGYRYFDTFNICPEYEFGYGKSYTDFEITVKQVRVCRDRVEIDAEVMNTGETYAGKEVVQIYTSAPCGELDKPYQELQAFAKTTTLSPHESQNMTLTFPITRMASYQEKDAAYILEAGAYKVRIGNSSRQTKLAAILELPEPVKTVQCQNLFKDSNDIPVTELRKKQKRNEAEEITGNIPVLQIEPNRIPTVSHMYQKRKSLAEKAKQDTIITFTDIKSGKAKMEALVSQMTAVELIKLCVGGARMSMKDFSVIGNASDTIPGAAGETTKELSKQRKIPTIYMADGPAGLHVNQEYYVKDGVFLKDLRKDPYLKNILPAAQLEQDMSGAEVHYQYCTAVPIATMLAQSWNEEMLYQTGSLVGEEMEELGIDLWLAPGMNIQRNPLGGRNFEYYSEDPVVSGICAAAIVEGVQACPGRGATIKHFAANNQETNRNYNNSHATERTLREIYLKGFELCISRVKPYSVMTAFNLINGIHAANSYDLLTSVLRDEWKFDGFVMTDWGTTSTFGTDVGKAKYNCSSSAECIRAGNDLIMPGSQTDEDRLLEAVKSGELERSDLEWCALNLLRVLLKKEGIQGN